MMRYSICLASLACICLVSIMPDVEARQRISRKQQEIQMSYGWSTSATTIFEGTVAGVVYRDDPMNETPYAQVTLRIDSMQRGNINSPLIVVRIEDEYQSQNWTGNRRRIGETGIWFVHRIRERRGYLPKGYLIRYITPEDLNADVSFVKELMSYSVQDTVDKTIKPNIMNLLTLKQRQNSQNRAKVILNLQYTEKGYLSTVTFKKRSEFELFNAHVYDHVMDLHRRMKLPGGVPETNITIERVRL